MTRKDIIVLPNPSLRQRSKKVGIISDDVLSLISNMQKATLDWEDSRNHEVGVALAAVQVNALLRVVIIRDNFDDKNNRNFGVFINPQIIKKEGSIVFDYEGCLSIKDIYGKVPRYEKIKIKALDITGKPIRLTATGFLARVLQHEIDHTNGIVLVDHIKNDHDAFYRLEDDGSLIKLDFEKDIKNNKNLWS